VAVTLVEISAEHRILLGGGHGTALFARDVRIARQNFSQITRRAKFISDHTNGNAGATLVASGAIGDRLAAPETAMRQQIIKVARLVANQMREDFALMPAGQIRAGRGHRKIELRSVTGVLGHGMSLFSKAEATDSIAPRRRTVNRFAQCTKRFSR
jgi:hypothetical protein